MKTVAENLKKLIDWFSPFEGVVVPFRGNR